MKKTRDDIQKKCLNTVLKFPRACATVGMGVGKSSTVRNKLVKKRQTNLLLKFP